MIDKGSISVPTILLKWKTLPPKYGTWNFAANADVFVVISDQPDKIKEYEAQDVKCKELTYTIQEKSLEDEGMDFQVNSWYLDNASWNQSWEFPS
ncbi:hypothetical protein MTR_6g033845 [Medicago truncatula]|nr:hypothetical protein MTR_6g033845 [Medicago truncatula]